MKRVLDVGNCGPDHGAICDLIMSNFDAEVVQAHGMTDALDELRRGSFDLVLVNRLMDRDGASGLSIIESIKHDAELGETPVMLISNYEEYQQKAVQLGAEPGFGKATLHGGETQERLSQVLR